MYRNQVSWIMNDAGNGLLPIQHQAITWTYDDLDP